MSITEELAKILARVDRPGDFYAVGRTELLAPRIEVKGVGPIALPLLAAKAKQLIKAATRAPYGRGAETIVDTNVRRTWQIEGSRVAIGGKHWAQTLAGIVQRAVEGLGVTGPVTALLYKNRFRGLLCGLRPRGPAADSGMPSKSVPTFLAATQVLSSAVSWAASASYAGGSGMAPLPRRTRLNTNVARHPAVTGRTSWTQSA